MTLLDEAGAGAASLVSRVLRPGAKFFVRTGITLYRTAMEPVSAVVGELVTEAQLELAASKASAPATVDTPHKAPARKHRRAAHGTAGHDVVEQDT